MESGPFFTSVQRFQLFCTPYQLNLFSGLWFYRSPFSQPYIELGNCYNDGKIGELEALVVARNAEFEEVNCL